jgi:hypothetical protein
LGYVGSNSLASFDVTTPVVFGLVASVLCGSFIGIQYEEIMCQVCVLPVENGGRRVLESATGAAYTLFAQRPTWHVADDVGHTAPVQEISSFPQGRLLLRSLSLIQNRVE